ncbi:hypothetical protein F4861DRAFT_163080 [Xylaria intraflava]|nr:hypothetical protein F4861DRAFT_163080 [Xylaria intraflava]
MQVKWLLRSRRFALCALRFSWACARSRRETLVYYAALSEQKRHNARFPGAVFLLIFHQDTEAPDTLTNVWQVSGGEAHNPGVEVEREILFVANHEAFGRSSHMCGYMLSGAPDASAPPEPFASRKTFSFLSLILPLLMPPSA